MKFKKFIENIFSVKNIGYHKQVVILGLKIKFRTSKLLLKEFEYLQNEKSLEMRNYIDSKMRDNVAEIKSVVLATKLHSSLEKYKSFYKGKDIVIVGCGPTLEYYKPTQNAIYIGINRAFNFNDINFDYLFVSDNFPEGMEELKNYNPETCIKFISKFYSPEKYNIDLVHNIDLLNIKHEEFVANSRFDSRMPRDLSLEPFGAYYLASTTLYALQFTLYTLPKRIFIIGCDCTTGSLYREIIDPNNPADTHEYQLSGWKLIKEDINKLYPDIEVITVNPIGLKGYFKDAYTQSYVDAHPELLNEDIEILKEGELCNKGQ